MKDALNTVFMALVLICTLIVVVVLGCCACAPVYRWIFPNGPFA